MTCVERGASLVRVAIDNAASAYDREYTYAVPAALRGRARPGALATVPFGPRNARRAAILLGSAEGADGGGQSESLVAGSEPDGFALGGKACVSHGGGGSVAGASAAVARLKEVAVIADGPPPLGPSEIRLAEYMREHCFCTWFDAFRCMLPKGWDSVSGSMAMPALKAARLAPGACPDALKNEQQRRAYDALKERGVLLFRDARRVADVGSGVLSTLARYGVAEVFDLESSGRPEDGWAPEQGPAPLHTPEQSAAVDAATRLLRGGMFSEMLVHGVTGSGKTEVYLSVIAKAVSMGLKTIALIPEISLTPQTLSRFRGRFGDNVAVFHSRMSQSERKGQWLRVKRGEAAIALGARSAVFAPHSSVGLVVIDEEHDGSYKSEMTPRYHAADIARFRCRESGGLTLYGSATPSIELAWRASAPGRRLTPDENSAPEGGVRADRAAPVSHGQGGVAYAAMRARATRRDLPQVAVVDMREELRAGNRGMFSRKLAQSLGETLEAGNQAMLLMNRRGYASFVLCRSCGYIATCRDCSVSYSYHMHSGRLHCHYCGMTAPVPDACPMCGQPDAIRQFGAGTERVEAEVRRMYPASVTLRMDRDTTTGKGAHARILRDFGERRADVLIGTQMIAKGHDFPGVALVGVVAADQALNFNDFRAPERAFQLMTQACGRAGRGQDAGKAIIQTYNPDHYSVAAASAHDYGAFCKQEIAARRELGYPPFRHIATVVLASEDDARCAAAARALRVAMLSCGGPREAGGLDALPPAKPPVEKAKGKHRWRVVVRHEDEDVLRCALRRAFRAFEHEKMSRFAELSADIDPFSMQ